MKYQKYTNIAHQIIFLNDVKDSLKNWEKPEGMEPKDLIKDVSECVLLASEEFGIKDPEICSTNNKEIVANFKGLYLSSKKEKELARVIRINIHIYEISAELKILAC